MLETHHTTSIHLKQTLDKPHKIKSVNGLNINAQDIGAGKTNCFYPSFAGQPQSVRVSVHRAYLSTVIAAWVWPRGFGDSDKIYDCIIMILTDHS